MGRFIAEAKDFNWRKELSGECLTYWHYICVDLDEIETFLTAAVYELLTGTRFVEQLPPEDGQVTTDVIRGMAVASYEASKTQKFEAEWKLAVKTASEAREELSKGYFFERSFDYIGLRKIGETVKVEFDKDEQGTYFIVSNESRQVGNRDGFPANFLHREINAEDFVANNIHPLTFIKDQFRLFLKSNQDIEHEILQSAMLEHFAKTVKAVPFSDAQVQSDYLWKIEKVKPRVGRVTAAELFEQMTPKQQIAVIQPKVTEVWFKTENKLETDEARADVTASLAIGNVVVYYDPETQTMQGNIDQSTLNICRVMLWNRFHPNTTHEGLIEIRENVLKICDAMGIKVEQKTD